MDRFFAEEYTEEAFANFAYAVGLSRILFVPYKHKSLPLKS